MSGEREIYETEKRYVHADGRIIWGALSSSVVRGADGAPQQIVSHIQDITERKQFQERLCYLADHDSLTDLYNRRRFESELERHVSLSRRYGDGAALMMLDLDHFKYVNDALGHHVGDQVIAHVGQLLANRLRSSDILARLGGDEYAVILPHVCPNALGFSLRSCSEQSSETRSSMTATATRRRPRPAWYCSIRTPPRPRMRW